MQHDLSICTGQPFLMDEMPGENLGQMAGKIPDAFANLMQDIAHAAADPLGYDGNMKTTAWPRACGLGRDHRSERMSKCIIIAPLYRGEERDALCPGAGDMLICADGGYDAAVRHGLKPDLVIGDFDSMPFEHVQGCESIRLPVHKDDTDMVVCLEEGRRRGYREFLIAGCLGGRLDHTISNMQCLHDCALRGETAWMLDGQNRVTVLLPGRYTLPRREGCKLSLLAFSAEVTGVTLLGTEWTLHDATLSSRYPLGVSNEIKAEKAELSFAEGVMYLIYAKDMSFVES